MTNNKLTNNEIIKALDNIQNHKWIFARTDNGDFIRTGDVADLINRLQAENERLIIRLRKVEHQLDDAMKMYNIIKAEAYKEFAEKWHEELRMYGVKDKFNKAVFLNVVDRAKKELVGEDK